MTFDETKTYWSGKGKHEKKIDVLGKLIDDTLVYGGSINQLYSIWTVTMPKAYSGGKNYHLERLRKAKNAYYRWYNDGDKNQIFGRALKTLCYGDAGVENVLNQKIEAAWQEQYGEAA